MKDKLFERVLENKCPICNKSMDKSKTTVVNYNDAKLKVCKRHVKIGDSHEEKN